jgi:hypothetical protein
MHHKMGHPLYCPEPNATAEQKHREDGVSIGDVGHITWLGEFEFAFNIYHPAYFATCSASMGSLNPNSKHLVGVKDFEPGMVFHSQGVNYERSWRNMSVGA